MDNRPVIIYRLGSLGDTIIALPCFHAIKTRFPDRRLIILTNFSGSNEAPPLMEVLGSDGQFADEVIEYPLSLRSPAALCVLASNIRKTGADTAVYLMPYRSRAKVRRDWAFLRLMAGIQHVLCLPDSEDLRTCRIDLETGDVEREASRLARCCAPLGEIDVESRRSWDLMLTDMEIARGDEMLAPFCGEPFVAIHMGGKSAEKDWGVLYWRTLSKCFAQWGEIGVLIVGAGKDFARAQKFLSGWRGPSVNACGLLSPRETGAAMQSARMFIGHDAGPLHLASAVGVPSIGLFGNYNRPKMWHPIGNHVHILHRIEGLDLITPDEVFVLAVELLEASEGKRNDARRPS